jgi:hypothetical protein
MSRALGIPIGLVILAGGASASAAQTLSAPTQASVEMATDAAEVAEEQAEEELELSEEAAIDALRPAVLAHAMPSANRLPALKRLLHTKHVLIRRVRSRIGELRALPLTSKRRIRHLAPKRLKIGEMRQHQRSVRASARALAVAGR